MVLSWVSSKDCWELLKLDFMSVLFYFEHFPRLYGLVFPASFAGNQKSMGNLHKLFMFFQFLN